MAKELNKSNNIQLSRKETLKVLSAGGIAALLVACGYNPTEELPTGTLFPPTVRPVTPTLPSTETSTATLKPTSTETSTPTPEPTNTSTPEAPYVPQGFEIGEGGLMPDENGVNLFKFNPNADWPDFRKRLIMALGKANGDTEKYRYTYPKSDISKYGYDTEKFYEAAIKGPVKIGIPVRDPSKDFDKSKVDYHFIQSMQDWLASGFTFDVQEVDFSKQIIINVVPPKKFEERFGPWLNLDNPTIAEGVDVENVISGVNPVAFAVKPDTKQLEIYTGSYYFGDNIFTNQSLYIGRPDPTLHEKYPQFFLPSGITNDGARNLSTLIGVIPEWLNETTNGHYTYPKIGGGKAKGLTLNHILVGIRDITGYPSDSSFLNPDLFLLANQN